LKAAEPAQPSASGGGAAGAAIEAPVTAEEARIRATVRRLGELYEKARSPEDRADVLEKIGQLGPRAAALTPLLDRAAEDPAAVVRAFAVRARAEAAPEKATPKLEAALKDAEEEVRMAAADVVGRLPAPGRWALPLEALRRETSARVQEALLSSVEKNEPGSDPIVSLVGRLRAEAAGQTPALAMPAVKPLFRVLARDPAAARDAAPLVAAYLGRHDADVRMLAARLLGTLNDRSEAVRAALVNALTDPEIAVRKAAFDVLKIWANKDFGYDPAAEGDARRDAVRAFAQWSRTEP
jgi:HEAT repeat protein